MRRRLAVALLAGALVVAASGARADTIYLEGGGVVRGTIVEEAYDSVKIRDQSGAVQTIKREDIAKIEREKSVKDDFEKKFSDAKKKEDADELAKLGLWARERKMEAEAKRCFELAVKLDPFCKPAREALGFKLWEGKWVGEEDWQKLKNGLVKWNDQWVTPEDKDKLEQGFVKNAEGLWERPEDRARREAEEEARKNAPPSAPREKPSDGPGPGAKGGTVEKPTPSPSRPDPPKLDPRRPGNDDEPSGDDGEDKGWYKDNTENCSFEQAPTYESKYYKIKTNVKPDYAKKYMAMLDGYYQLFIDVFKPTSLPNRKSEVWIYASQQQFMAATGMSQGVGGFYSSGNKRVTAFHGLFGMSGTTRTVLSHEGTHQFEDIYLGGMGFGNCPIWVIEGLAVFFESATFDGTKAHVATVPRDRLANMKHGAETGSLIPLSQLFRTPQPQFTAYHYAHAWSVIYMILYYHKDPKLRQRNLEMFDKLLTDSRTKRVAPEDVEKMFGGKDAVAKFEDEWRKWIVELPYDFDPKKAKK